jgi:hypothetical protein
VRTDEYDGTQEKRAHRIVVHLDRSRYKRRRPVEKQPAEWIEVSPAFVEL